MSAAELLPSIQSLPRAEKLALIQLLAADLAEEERGASSEPQVQLLPRDQCPYTVEQLLRMRGERGGRSLAEIRQRLGWK
jgi:hypothetical protein